MTNRNINRRDFLKLGGLAALTLPAFRIMGKLGEDTLVASEEEYGGFLIRQKAKNPPPYVVDDSVYQRFDAKYTILNRMGWDPTLREKLQGVRREETPNEPGYRREDQALSDAAGMLSTYGGANAPMGGRHNGLLQVTPIGGGQFESDAPWDHSHLSDQDLSNMVKKAAKFMGASLVGITELDERWIYSTYAEMMNEGTWPILFDEVEEVKLPAGTVSLADARDQVLAELQKMDAEAVKTLIVETMKAEAPSDAPESSMLLALPASMLVNMLPTVLKQLPTSTIQILAGKLGLTFTIAAVSPGDTAKPRYLEDGTLVIPKTMNRVIVLAFEMDADAVDAAPTLVGMAAMTNGYSRMTFTASSLAEFIRNLGYNAIPCGNHTGLSVPMAIDAGLGELSRMGILITPKYGPRIRLAKIITDLPVATDQPISFGVKEFCDVCKKCAEMCPTQAISFEGQTFEPRTISNNPGVLKWPLDNEKCFTGWQMTGGDCGNCIRVCPFNKPESWLHEATRILIGAKIGTLDSVLTSLDTASGYGGEKPEPEAFWKKDSFIHIKG